MKPLDPIRPTDDAARALARRLIAEARIAALGVLDATGAPMVSRIAIARDGAGLPLALVSDLAAHVKGAARRSPRLAAARRAGAARRPADPSAADPAGAGRAGAEDAERPALAELWLAAHPKAKIYAGLADFRFLRFQPVSALSERRLRQGVPAEAADLGLEETGDG